MQNRLEALEVMVDAHGIRLGILESPYEGIEEFDKGLRRQLYQSYDYKGIMAQLEADCQENKLYLVRDIFGLCYIVFKIPSTDRQGKKCVLIGPYLEEGNEPDPMAVVEQRGLELYHVQLLKTFYQGICVMKRFENIVISLVKAFFSEEEYELAHSGLKLVESSQNMPLRIKGERRLPMEIVEERYRQENLLLEAIEHGDETKAMLAWAGLGKFSVEKRSADSLRNGKNYLLTFNVLLRKAVEKAGVHPYYIDELSSSFARRIEAARNTADVYQVNREIIRKYCLLVRNYAMRGYSELVDKSVNYIELNLAEELCLHDLASRFNVNASYLSRKFRKEVGMTVTDYINHKRISSSLELLATTHLPIGEIAELVGILNENYYSRLFRNLQGMTPREYRSRMIGDK